MNQNASATGTSSEVLEYYARNWETIANCYALDGEGLPNDPAWYRRQLYSEFLARRKPASLLDIGCGGGWTVLDALEAGVDARGIEPVAELKDFGRKLLESHGHDPDRIAQDDLASLATMADESLDCIALLSVLPHVPAANFDDVHTDIARVLRPGGRLVAAYRNELFDFYTFNSFTVEMCDRTLWNCEPCAGVRTPEVLDGLKGLITNPDVPGPYFTAARDKSFGKLERVRSNPMTTPSYLSGFGLGVDRIDYYHFHCVPPLLSGKVEDFRGINHRLEGTISSDWRGAFMAAMFLVEAVKQ